MKEKYVEMCASATIEPKVVLSQLLRLGQTSQKENKVDQNKNKKDEKTN